MACAWEECVADLETTVARFRQTVAELQEELRKKDRALAARDERIKELEAALEEFHRAGKHQGSPFSKGEPKQTRSAQAASLATHTAATATGWHRPARRTGNSTLPCRAAAPTAGANLEHERDAEQWQVDIGEQKPVTTRFRVEVGRCKRCGRRVC